MFQINAALWLALAAGCGASSAQQPAPRPVPEVPAAPPYHSAFDGYQPFKDQETAPWQESNDNVRKAGGWRAYAREVQEGAARRPAAPAPAAAPPAGANHKH